MRIEPRDKITNTSILIPQYQIRVRTPDTGWQTVAARYGQEAAERQYHVWIDRTAHQMSVSLNKIMGDNMWSVLKSFDPK